ncbi:MAG: ATP phosphoribosyltransferase [Deltaproteobacteria bacterium]|nr:ATP phosphoribosyltransferase [Deltaproteobacteria bacterium]
MAETRPVRLIVPKGHMFDGVRELLAEAGLRLGLDDRSYRPKSADPRFRVKIVRSQNVPQLLELGAHDIGFSGRDWIEEREAKVAELFDLGLDPVRVVVAACESETLESLRARRVIAASEYERLTRRWLEARDFQYVFVQSYGSTEVFPPEDADLIVDNCASGATLRANGLRVLEDILTSSTRLIACPASLDDPGIREVVEDLKLNLEGVLLARRKVLLEMNVPKALLESVLPRLPAMKSPTVAPLAGEEGFAVKIAVDRDRASALIPELKRLGVTDILETRLAKIIP